MNSGLATLLPELNDGWRWKVKPDVSFLGERCLYLTLQRRVFGIWWNSSDTQYVTLHDYSEVDYDKALRNVARNTLKNSASYWKRNNDFKGVTR